MRGRPLLAYSVAPLVEAGCSPIVIAIPGSVLDRSTELGLDGVEFVEGGDTRQASVAAALSSVESEQVVVHDAARPFISPGLVRRVLDALAGVDAAIAAVPVDETLKRVVENRVTDTIPRDDVWRVQTPQAFLTERLKAAHDHASRTGFVGTDDAQLIEHNGGRVAVVMGERTNIKVTFPEDLDLAERML